MMHAMARLVGCLVLLVVVLGACSSSGSGKPRAASTSTTGSTTTSAPASSTTTSRPHPTTTASTTTTTVRCASAGSTAAVTTPQSQVSALLTAVGVTSGDCTDKVVFHYQLRGVAPPSCTIGYRAGPFVKDASGAPVTVAGNAFVAVRCFPAYTFNFETGQTTYSGPKRVAAPGAHHVKEVVLIGDNEGVLTWIIGLDSQRPFVVAATGTPGKQLTITFS